MNYKKIVIVTFVLVMIMVTGCSTSNTTEDTSLDNTETSKEIFAMDTYMVLTAYGSKSQEAIEEAVEEIKRLDVLLSTGSEDSEVSKLNANHGGKLSEDTLILISRAIQIYESTKGAFDITVYPIMKLWGFTDENYKIPEKKELEEVMKMVNSDYLTVEGKTLTIEDDGIEIDLGGIAKGYTSSKVMEIFESYDITSAMINLGGNVQVLGGKTDGTNWRVAITDPENEDSYIGTLEVNNKAVITSGGYERYFEKDNKTYHHIIDPKTGYPADNGLSSVTIVSDDGTLADALSTALFVMGSDKAIAYCKNNMEKDNFGAILYTDNGDIYVTQNISDQFSVTEGTNLKEKIAIIKD